MDLKQLKYFSHVAELGSFTRAAAVLLIAQPTLSREVRQLEVELKQTLLVRNGRGVAVTDAGRRLLAHSLGILQQVERAKLELAEAEGEPVGNVSVGIPPSVGRVLTVPLVTEFQKRFPKANIRIIEGMSAHIVEWLSTGRLDLGLIYDPAPNPEIDISSLVEDQLYLIGPNSPATGARPRNTEVSLADLPNYPLIIPSRPHAVRMYVETQMAHAGLKMNVAWEIDGIPSILDLVRQGFGYAVLPLMAIRGNGSTNSLFARAISNPTLASVLALASSSRRLSTPLSHQVENVLRELAQTYLLPIRPRALAGTRTKRSQ